ncbi:MAG: hypothetical protein MHM6MM_008174 [Cercozoa sp. M6MM]
MSDSGTEVRVTPSQLAREAPVSALLQAAQVLQEERAAVHRLFQVGFVEYVQDNDEDIFGKLIDEATKYFKRIASDFDVLIRRFSEVAEKNEEHAALFRESAQLLRRVADAEKLKLHAVLSLQRELVRHQATHDVRLRDRPFQAWLTLLPSAKALRQEELTADSEIAELMREVRELSDELAESVQGATPATN